MFSLLKMIFGSQNDRELKALSDRVRLIASYEPQMQKMSLVVKKNYSHVINTHHHKHHPKDHNDNGFKCPLH